MRVIKNPRLRVALSRLIPFLLIPALVIFGALAFDQQRSLIISLGVAALSLLLFMTGYERSNIGSRRMVLTAVMTALAVVGRFIPVLKPITAICMITGMYLGAQAGFLGGSLSVLISNFYFGQGPWTAFQMLGFGLIGLIAGYLSRPLIKSKALLLIYGAGAGVAYSFIMDIWTVLWYSGGFDPGLYLAALASALPFTISYAVSNIVFLLLLGKPMGEKLSRVKLKYGV